MENSVGSKLESSRIRKYSVKGSLLTYKPHKRTRPSHTAVRSRFMDFRHQG